MPTRILGLLGSPRKNGNAGLLLDQALSGAKAAGAETERLAAAELKIAPCLACEGCRRTGECVVHDDMTQVYRQLQEADGVIVSTAVFFMGLPAQLKALVDRCQPFWVRKYRLSILPEKKRRGLLIAVGGTNLPHTFDAVRLEVKSFFHCLNVDYAGELLFPAVQEHGEIAKNPEALNSVRRAGEELAQTLLQPQRMEEK